MQQLKKLLEIWLDKIIDLRSGKENMNNSGQYKTNEIKYNIDTAIQKSMYETDQEKWKVILEVQSRLYEEFGIEE